jgi:hypothetical protein
MGEETDPSVKRNPVQKSINALKEPEGIASEIS